MRRSPRLLFRFICCTVVTCLVESLPAAQLPAEPRFEVASIKPNLREPGPAAPPRVSFSGDRATLLNQTLRTLVQIAYGVQDVRGGPRWVGMAGPPASSDLRFDVLAKAEQPTTRQQMQLMLRGLLVDRFKLAFHIETAPEQVWALVLARRDGKLGPSLRPAQTDCETLRANPPAGQNDPCGMRTLGNARITGTVAVRGMALDIIEMAVGTDRHERVVNKTGLAGPFDWELKWTPEPCLRNGCPGFPQIDPDGPSIFQAVQEQLGLKLVSEPGQKEVLVIDQVERPSEN